MYIDAHCHLERETFGDELDEVIARAFTAGLTHIVAVGASGVTHGAREAVALAERVPGIFAAIGLHPHEAAKASAADVEIIAELLGRPEVVALGEVGLDYHYDFAPRDVQLQVFRWMLQLARAQNIPVMLHTREAHADTLALIDEMGLPERGGVVHCFTGTAAQARDYVDRGLHLSIPGVVTFKKSQELQQAVRETPLDRLLIETDSPYLAPVPHRGKRNEPAFVIDTAAVVGSLKGLSGEDIGRIAARNTIGLFDLPVEAQTSLAYPIRQSLYVNLTSRCTLACTFCPKIERRDWWVKGHWLRLSEDPSEEDVQGAIDAQMQRRPDIREVVFVGLGEPTLRLPELLSIAARLRKRHGHALRLRVDTDGLANLVYGRNVAAELAELIDAVSVSLNAPDANTYAGLCKSKHGVTAYEGVKAFIVAAREAGLEVTATAVGVPGLDVHACERVASELGVGFRHRFYQQYG